MDQFVLKAPYAPSGDQPQAIEALAAGIKAGLKDQILLGVTGSGKTFTMASVIEKVQKPTLVIAHNKTLAAQLCSELKAFFPDSRVEYFVSYYDYYQPEAYIASPISKKTPPSTMRSTACAIPPRRRCGSGRTLSLLLP